MLALMVPSKTQSNPAAIQTVEQFGIKINAREAMISTRQGMKVATAAQSSPDAVTGLADCNGYG